MKYLLILITLLFISCNPNTAPKGMTYLITLSDGNVIECNNYKPWDGKSDKVITVDYIHHGDYKTTLVPYEPNLLYNMGYKQGQIDAIEHNACYAKVLTNDGEVLWKDTCSVKRKPKI
jgi:hypothetical protein